MSKLTHINQEGQAHMVDISEKPTTTRTAIAQAYITMQPTTLQLIIDGGHKKGDVFATARIAGIQAAKKCADLIPLCHPLALSNVTVELTPELETSRVKIQTHCKITDKTGVEMEALTAASVAALTLYDMCKSVDKTMTISELHIVEKSGGQSDWST